MSEPFAQPGPSLRGAYGTVPGTLQPPTDTSTADFLASLTTVVVAGTVAEAGTYSITSPALGVYCLEFGAQQMDSTTGTGNVKNITASTGGTAAVYSDTGSSGAIGIQTNLALADGQTVTLTCNHVSGSTVAGLLGCWAKLTRLS